jgi:mono/diheme cytochrome c family protein
MTRRSLLPTAALILCSATALLAARRLPKEVTEGRVLYTRYCASCHGLAADGPTIVAYLASIQAPAASLEMR